MARLALLTALMLVGCRAAGTPDVRRHDLRGRMPSAVAHRDQAQADRSPIVNAVHETPPVGADGITTADFSYSGGAWQPATKRASHDVESTDRPMPELSALTLANLE